MTEPTTRAREAGARLNAEVAQALGWRAWKEKRGDYSLCVQVAPGVREPWLNVQKPEPTRYSEVSCIDAQTIGFFGTGFPNFSSDISAAFLVVDAMRAKGWKYRVGSGFVKAHFATFWRFAETGFFEAGGCHEGESLPLAICLSALEALAASPPPRAVSATENPSPASLS